MLTVPIIKYVFVTLLGFLVTYLLIPVIIRWAPKVGLLDQPDVRRIHKTPTPRGGGLAVIIGFHAACAGIFLIPWANFAISLDFLWWGKLLVLSIGVLVIGLWDDLRNIRPHFKLAGQIAIGCVAYGCGLQMNRLLGIPLPDWLDLLATVIWFVAVMNAFNLIDGMDGLATGLGAISSAGMAGAFVIMSLPGNALVMVGLLGACLAFLRFNFHPARIFLGDTGSMFIGFVIAAVALSTNAKGLVLATVVVPLLAVGLPLFDTFLAIWRRIIRKILHKLSPPEQQEEAGRRLFGADLEHLHHRLLSRGFSQRKTALYLYIGGGILMAVGLLAMVFRNLALGLYGLVFSVATYIAIKHITHVELWNSSLALAKGLNRPGLRQLTVPLYIAVDLAILLGAFISVQALFMPEVTHAALRQLLLQDAIIGVGCPFLCLVAGRTYLRVWSLAQPIDHARLALCLLGGTVVVSFVVVPLMYAHEIPHQFTGALLFFICALLGIGGVRLLPRVIVEFVAYLSPIYNPEKRQRHQVLIYGAGAPARLFLRAEAALALRKGDHHTIVGFLDEDTNLHGRLVCGYKVLGGITALEDILKGTRIDRLIITDELTGPALVALNKLLAVYPVLPLVWRTTLQPLDAGDLAYPLLRNSPRNNCTEQRQPPLDQHGFEGQSKQLKYVPPLAVNATGMGNEQR